jgi:multiple sugar transport system substrate-binding protein
LKKPVMYVLALLLLFGTVLAGCSSSSKEEASSGNTNKVSDNNTSKEENKPVPVVEKEVVLKFWGASDFLREGEPGDLIVKEFNEKNKGKIKVELSYMPWEQFNTAMQAAFASKDVPDIFRIPQGMDVRQMIENNWIRPLDDLVSKEWKTHFYPGAFADGVNIVDGKTYTWPTTGPELRSILYYNKDVMKNAGLDPNKPPKTWDELTQMSKQVTEAGKGNVFGLIFGGANAGIYTSLSFGLGAGVDPENLGDISSGFNYKTGEYGYGSAALAESVKYLKQLKDDGLIFPAAFTMKPPEARTLFAEGQAAFYIDARWQLWMMKRDQPQANLGMAPVPSKTGNKPMFNTFIASPEGIVVSADTKHAEAVGKFIEEAIASPEFYTKYMKSGIALTPMPKVNQDKSNHPWPEFADFVTLHEDLMRIGPSTGVRNPQSAKVYAEIGNINQPKIKPNIGEIMQMYLMGKEKDIDGAMKSYNDKMNKGLKEAIDKLKQSGVEVSHNDFVFPNWNFEKDYTPEDYKALK